MSYRIQEADIDTASRILGKAFIDYPLFTYILPDRKVRQKNIHHLFTFLIRMAMSTGDVLASSSNMEGVSIWVDPPGGKAGPAQPIRAGIARLLLNIHLGAFIRFNEIGYLKRKARARVISAPYSLLDVMGIDPTHQRRGHASQMMHAQLREYDEQGIPCYLETSDLRNLPFYERFGLHVVHHYAIRSLPVYCMKRERRTGAP